MKILTNKVDYNIIGIMAIAKKQDIDFRYWDEKEKSAFDIFDEFQPDIFLWDTLNTSRALLKCLNNNDMKIVAIDTDEKGAEFIQLSLAGKVSGLYENKPLADTVNFQNKLRKPEIASELLIITDWLGTADPITIIQESKLHPSQVKLFGIKYVPHPSYIGLVKPEEYKYFITASENTWCIPGGSEELNISIANGKPNGGFAISIGKDRTSSYGLSQIIGVTQR